jgi:Cu(I)/Ag(I) efflux system membrane fusion protein
MEPRTHDGRHDEAPSGAPPRGRRSGGRALVFGLVFAGALLAGLVLGSQVLERAHRLVPNPNAGHDVPSAEGREAAARPTVIDPVLVEDEYATVDVDTGPLVRTIHTIGTIDYAEPRIGDVTLKIDGWLEKLYVDYEGEPVRRGDPMFDLYSPDLVATQQEFLTSLQAWQEAKRTNNAAVLEVTGQNVATARQRLRFWDVTDKQIDELVRTGKVRKALEFYSPFDGIVVEKHAFAGKYLPAGQLLYRVADLAKVWVHVFVYQNQIHCVGEGQGATLRLANLPGRAFQGKVVYIYPYLDPTNRAVKVRLEFENPGLVLKPGMFADVLLAPHRMGTGIKIPQKAVLRTGERSLVYLSRPENKFQPREVTTGMELDGGMVEVLAGLQEGEPIVTAPSFLMDSESRLRAVDRRFGPAPDWMKLMPPVKMPGMNMPGMEGDRQMPATKGSRP